ncbi:hypothetical protein PPACK8108_LOCUS841 [Phakopsora pachyrhizi]|uniref:Uncharacterized protein n=1 Tax=Phakopsora pachyrhizi TaxID=170000 RepID=A0AAV0AEJ0_PHAPC|nr:hypothetical protein PPACK8108_LOCUS841 [Phakopsora pachyrhizi]
MAPMASLQVSKVKCNFPEPTETRGPLVWCNTTIKAYGYEHPIARTPTEDLDSGVSSKGKSRLMVAVGIPSEQISDFSARANLMKHQAALDLAQKKVEDAQEDLRNEVEPATQKRKECVREVIDLEDQSQGTRSPSSERIRVPARPTDSATQPPPQHQPLIPTTSVLYSNPVNPPGHRPEIEAGPSSPDRLTPGLGLVPLTFDHPSEDVLEFENDKERARSLLVNTRRLLYSKFVQRGREMDGLLTHAITQLSDWYETLEVENYEGFEWDDSHGKRKAEDSP